MNKKTRNLLIFFINITILTLLTCGLLNKPMDLKLPGSLYDGDATESKGEALIEIYDYEDTDLLIELEVIDDNDDDLKKILIIPPYVKIPQNELSAEFTCTAFDTDMGGETEKVITVRASALHYRDAEDQVTVNDTLPEPTPVPTATPTPNPEASPGTVWLEPSEIEVAVDDDFTTEVHCNSGDKRLAAYGLDFNYFPSSITIDTSEVPNGVTVIEDDFAVNVGNDDGKLSVGGFFISGIDPGTDIHLFTIHWTAVSTGQTTINIDIDSFVDETATTIGDPNGLPCIVTID